MIQPKDELIRDTKISGIKKQVAECINAAFSKGYETCFEQKKEIEDRAYQKGLEEAWEVIRRLMLTSAEGGIPTDELTKMFGTGVYSIIRDRSIYEVKENIEAWVQQQDNEIKVGDEVIYHGENTVILRVYDDYIKIMYSDGTTNCTHPDSITKTGRHFDQIADVLKQMQE